MGNRRMISKQIIDTDLFLEMPIGSRLLYYDLIVRADDDGFVDSPRKIMKIIGATIDDMRVLIAKNLVIEFESGVVVITDWRIHNYIQGDRYHPTIHTHERKQITLNEETKKYEKINKNEWIQDGYKMDTEVKLSKVKLSKDKLNNITKDNNNKTPTYEEIDSYCKEKNIVIDIDEFIHYWTEKDWKRWDKNLKRYVPIKDIKGTIRTWAKNQKLYEEERQLKNGTKKAYIKDVEYKTKQQETTQQKNQKKLDAIGEALKEIGEEYELSRDTKYIG